LLPGIADQLAGAADIRQFGGEFEQQSWLGQSEQLG
jgi:hypothetical protein